MTFLHKAVKAALLRHIGTLNGLVKYKKTWRNPSNENNPELIVKQVILNKL